MSFVETFMLNLNHCVSKISSSCCNKIYYKMLLPEQHVSSDLLTESFHKLTFLSKILDLPMAYLLDIAHLLPQ